MCFMWSVVYAVRTSAQQGFFLFGETRNYGGGILFPSVINERSDKQREGARACDRRWRTEVDCSLISDQAATVSVA